MMEMTKTEVRGVPVIVLSGRLDMAGAQEIDLKFTAQTSAEKVSTVVDLSGVSFVGSMGIRMFIRNTKALALSGHKLVLAGAKNEVAEVLRVAGVTDAIELFDTVDAALDSLTT